MELANIAAVVSGGASGLGFATAQALRAAGARVALLDVDAAAVARAAAALGALGVVCDVSDAASSSAALAEARATLGTERLLVHCAGVAPAARIVGRNGPLPLEDFARVVAINLNGSFNLLRLSAAAMKTQLPIADGERGLVVLTASIAAFDGQVGQAAYAASKAGVVGLVLPAARELAACGVRVCGIAPGVFETPLIAAMPDDVREAITAAVPFPPRAGRPAEFAALVCHLASNVMLNGEVIRIDGAYRMPPR